MSGKSTGIWMTIYADMVTNLMFFFLAAWVLSRVDKDIQSKVSDAFRMRITGTKYTEERLDAAKNINENYINDYSKIEITEKRIKITLSDSIFFESGSSVLTESTKKVLKGISGILKKTNNTIVVEGYTDNVPRRVGSNWELSLGRALSVVDYFVNVEGILRTRFMAAGYGEYKPVAPNDTAENRKRNRRIEITVLRYE